MKTSKLKFNPNNPRKCSKDKLEKLMRSIESFPEMMKLRPIVYDPETMCVLGGNQRLAARSCGRGQGRIRPGPTGTSSGKNPEPGRGRGRSR